MLKVGFLAGTAFYAATPHVDAILEQYEDEMGQVFKKISFIWDHENPTIFLDSRIAESGFKRLN